MVAGRGEAVAALAAPTVASELAAAVLLQEATPLFGLSGLMGLDSPETPRTRSVILCIHTAVSTESGSPLASLPPPKALTANTTTHAVLDVASATAQLKREDTQMTMCAPSHEPDIATHHSSSESIADTDSDTALLDEVGEVGGTEVEALSSSDESGESEAAAKRPRPSVERSSCTDEPKADSVALAPESPTPCVA